MKYAFGSSQDERRRLQEQGEIIRRVSESFLKEARIKRGMRILEVGCGAGDFTLLIRDLVGPTGHITAIDSDPTAVVCARSRILGKGIGNISFLAADVRSMPLSGSFDAVVGRFILAYVDELMAVLLNLVGLIRRRGIVAFQEWDHSRLPWSFPHLDTFDKINRRVIGILRQAGVNLYMASSLNQVLQQPRFYSPRFFVQTYVASGVRPVLARYLLDTLVNLEKARGRIGCLDSVTLQNDMLLEQSVGRAIISLSPLIGVWTRIRE